MPVGDAFNASEKNYTPLSNGNSRELQVYANTGETVKISNFVASARTNGNNYTYYSIGPVENGSRLYITRDEDNESRDGAAYTSTRSGSTRLNIDINHKVVYIDDTKGIRGFIHNDTGGDIHLTVFSCTGVVIS